MDTSTKLQELAATVDEVLLILADVKQALLDLGIEVPEGTSPREYGNIIRNIQNGEW